MSQFIFKSNIFKLFGFAILWLSTYRINVTPETCGATKLDIYAFIGLQNCKQLYSILICTFYYAFQDGKWRHHGHDRMVVGFTTTYIYIQSVPITTNVVNSNPVHGEVYLIQHDVIKFVSDLWQVNGFLRNSSFLHQ